MVGPEHPLAAGQRPLEVRDGLAEPSRSEARAAQVGAGGQRVGVTGSQRLLKLPQGLGQHVEREVGSVGRLVGLGEQLKVAQGLRAAGLLLVAAGVGQLPPVGDRRAAQPGRVQALARAQQQRVAVRLPHHRARGLAQGRRAVA